MLTRLTMYVCCMMIVSFLLVPICAYSAQRFLEQCPHCEDSHCLSSIVKYYDPTAVD